MHHNKMIIAGSRRGFTYNEIRRCFLDTKLSVSEIVSGCATGVDTFGEQLAKELNIPVKKFPANWDLYGKSAGYKRNKQMAEYADALFAFRYDHSKGTTHMINLARDMGLYVYLVDKKVEQNAVH